MKNCRLGYLPDKIWIAICELRSLSLQRESARLTRNRIRHVNLAEMAFQGLSIPCLLCVVFVYMYAASSTVTNLVQRRYLTSVQPSDVWPKYIYQTVIFDRKPSVGVLEFVYLLPPHDYISNVFGFIPFSFLNAPMSAKGILLAAKASPYPAHPATWGIF